MIISKLDSVIREKADAHTDLCRFLNIPRGCKKARIEAILRQENANTTGICPGCSGPLYNSPKLNGWCRSCDSKIGRMMLYKSRVRHYEPVGIRMTERFVDDYETLQTIPYALHGEVPPAEVLNAAKRYLYAMRKEAALYAARKEMEVQHEQM